VESKADSDVALFACEPFERSFLKARVVSSAGLTERSPQSRTYFNTFYFFRHPGFTHAAFVFGYESFVHKSQINGNDVPPGALISFIQKGLQYLEMEANLVAEVTQPLTALIFFFEKGGGVSLMVPPEGVGR
jgi:hypothetical protein